MFKSFIILASSFSEHANQENAREYAGKTVFENVTKATDFSSITWQCLKCHIGVGIKIHYITGILNICHFN